MKLSKALLHLTIILSFMMLVLFTIDIFNTAMGFLSGDEFRFLLALLCIVAITSSIVVLVKINGRRKSNHKK